MGALVIIWPLRDATVLLTHKLDLNTRILPMRILIALLLCLPTTALAQTYFTTIDADLTGDGFIDHAELSENIESGEADLNIWVRQADGKLKLSSSAKSLVWVGGIGQQPELSVSSHGSLLVHSMNDSIGRNRWHQTLTIAWRGSAFTLAGYTYESYDTLDLNAAHRCDVNLLNGKGERAWGYNLDGKTTFRTKSRGGPIDNWDRNPPAECATEN